MISHNISWKKRTAFPLGRMPWKSRRKHGNRVMNHNALFFPTQDCIRQSLLRLAFALLALARLSCACNRIDQKATTEQTFRNALKRSRSDNMATNWLRGSSFGLKWQGTIHCKTKQDTPPISCMHVLCSAVRTLFQCTERFARLATRLSRASSRSYMMIL